MSNNFEEIYSNGEKELANLVQEWINENIENITCKSRETKLQYRQN